MYLVQRFSIIDVFEQVVRDNDVDTFVRYCDGLHIKLFVGDSRVEVCGVVFSFWQHRRDSFLRREMQNLGLRGERELVQS